VSFQPTLLEDCLDPWLAVEPDRDRRETVVRFLMALCNAEGRWDDARPVPGTKLPAFAAMVPSQLAIRYLYDISTG